MKRSEKIVMWAGATGIAAAVGVNWLFGGAHWGVLLVVGLVVMTIANTVWLWMASLTSSVDRD